MATDVSTGPAVLKPLSWLRVCLAACLAAAVWAGAAPMAGAQDRTPLPVDDQPSLYQRVLTRPGAVLRATPGDTAQVVDDLVPTFTVFYVYDRREADGRQWAEVGGPVRGPAEGWVRLDQVIEWRHAMVVAFNNPANRERVLFFDDRDDLVELMESELLVPRSHELRDQAIAETLPPDSPVISIEPETPPDLSEEFYLLPILDADRVWLNSGFETTILRVASIPLHEEAAEAPSSVSFEEALRNFDAGIVFVIDTTTSMGPYIDRTREAVRRIYARIGDSEIADRVSFGLVGFRDSTTLVPELDYVTRTFVELERGSDPEDVLRAIDGIAPAAVSSIGFNEDSLAGLQQAINLEGWSKHEFGGRYIVLITDAGPRASGDPNSSTHMGPAEINSQAQESNIAIFTLHLLTPAGTAYHDGAAAAYRQASAFNGLAEPLYYPVQEGDVGAFGQQVDRLADILIGQVRNAVQGRVEQATTQAETELERQAQLVGRAMQLAYLGRVTGSRAPDVFQAWTADSDFDDPRRRALEVRVLLSKRQLSDLAQVLRLILEAGRSGETTADQFFGRLRSAVTQAAVDPNLVAQTQFESLGELVGQYIAGLPYQSQLMEIDEDEWNAIGPGGQVEILDTIESKLELYDQFDRNVGLWVPLYDGAPPSEHVYPVPLNALP
ncbi:MAG: VWA domain-containing protein [Rhodospirillaceae bacterium]|nr:VWA domain-containing protein [Rhodospirillaceae bacterium]